MTHTPIVHHHRRAARLAVVWLFLLGLTLGLPGPAFALDGPSPTELSELRARLEALEQQNRELRAAFDGRMATDRDIHLPTPQPDPLWFHESGADAHHDHHNHQYCADTWCDACNAAAGASPLGMTASWRHGLELITEDRQFRVHVGGRTQFDTAWFDADPNVQRNINIPYGDGVGFRRARLRIDGTMYRTIEWAVEYDFVNAMQVRNAAGTGTSEFSVTAITDLWWTFTEVPVLGNIRIGNQKEAIGFEHLVSSRFLPFMERSFNQDTFYGGAFNGFTPGISAFDNYAGERGMWQIGLYKPTDNVFAYSRETGDYAVTGRITYLPWYEDDGRELLHLGFSSRLSSTVNDRTRFRTRDAVRSAVPAVWPVPADTGVVFGDDMQWLNAELAMVRGPWTFQSEYLVSFLQDARRTQFGPDVGTLFYHGGYVQLFYFLTGESDHYNPKTAVFERVTPRESFPVVDHCGFRGIGAWQVGARYNYLDLNDQGINGGILHNLTAGLNWFLNPNMKMQFNYSATHRNAPLLAGAGDGWIHGFGLRVAHDF
jgi:phosphate-selective porin OprO and OprP